jgi:hypothetical protein
MMLLAHGALGICPLEVATALGGVSGLWVLRFQLAWWCKTFKSRVQGLR